MVCMETNNLLWIDFVKTLNDYLCQFNQDLPLRTTTKPSMYSVKDLYEGIHKRIGIPIVFDYHHYKFNTGGQTEQEALEMALSTWPDDIVSCSLFRISFRRKVR